MCLLFRGTDKQTQSSLSLAIIKLLSGFQLCVGEFDFIFRECLHHSIHIWIHKLSCSHRSWSNIWDGHYTWISRVMRSLLLNKSLNLWLASKFTVMTLIKVQKVSTSLNKYQRFERKTNRTSRAVSFLLLLFVFCHFTTFFCLKNCKSRLPDSEAYDALN